MAARRAAAQVGLALLICTGAASAHAQSGASVSLDPANARLGTSLVLGVDAPEAPLAVTLPRGTRIDSAAARRGTRIGFGRYVMDVQGFLPGGGGSTQLVWSLSAALGPRAQKGDLAAVVVTATLLGADTAAAVLQPVIGAQIPASTTTTARFVRSGGRIELRLAALPVALAPAPPATATPSRLELSLSAGRRVRQTFFHRVKVPTAAGGFRIERIRDHRLVAHDLLRTPPDCSGSWSYALRMGAHASTGRIPCLGALSAATSAARRRA